MQPTKQQSGYTRQQTCFTQNTCIKICNQPSNNQDTQDNRYASHKTHAQRYETNQTTIRLHKTTGMCHIKHIKNICNQLNNTVAQDSRHASHKTRAQRYATNQTTIRLHKITNMCHTKHMHTDMQPTKQQSGYIRQ